MITSSRILRVLAESKLADARSCRQLMRDLTPRVRYQLGSPG